MLIILWNGQHCLVSKMCTEIEIENLPRYRCSIFAQFLQWNRNPEALQLLPQFSWQCSLQDSNPASNILRVSESFWILDMSRFAAWWRHIFRHKYIRHICHRLGCSVSNRPPSNHWDTSGTTPTFNKTFLCTCHSGSWNLWKRIQSENKTRINFCNKNHNFH